MSLKSFHLVFIACAGILACLIGVWALNSPALGGTARIATAVGAFGAGLALAAYGVWFRRRYAGSRR